MRTSKTGRGPWPPESRPSWPRRVALGPLVLITLGVSGAWISNLARWSPIARSLSASRWWRCSSPGVASFGQWKSASREVCAVPRVRTGYKAIFWLVSLLVLIALVFPYILPCSIKRRSTMKARFAFIALLALLSTPALAALQTVTLSVPGMTCAACPITVKAALNKVDGVSQVDVSYADLEAVVTFDDARTSVEALTEATINAGYPSTPTSSQADRE